MVGEFGVKCTSLDHQQMNGNPMELNRPTRKVDFGSSKCSSKKLNPNSNVKQFSQDGFNFLDIFSDLNRAGLIMSLTLANEKLPKDFISQSESIVSQRKNTEFPF